MITLVILALLCLATSQVIPLHHHVINEIFQDNKVYLIYVHGTSHNFEAEGVFNTYCFGDKLCAVLEPNIENYEQVLEFVGKPQEEYFLIIDPISKFKYVLSLPQIDPITDRHLLEFQYQAIHHQIEPFFASEPIPIQNQTSQSEVVVGKTLGQFVRRKEKVKVVLLFTLNGHCQACPTILQSYYRFAKDYPLKEEVVFGHFNTFLNDHPAIRDEKTPNFIIFAEDRYHSPYEMPADDFQQLDIFIRQLLYESSENDSHSQQEISEEETL